MFGINRAPRVHAKFLKRGKRWTQFVALLRYSLRSAQSLDKHSTTRNCPTTRAPGARAPLLHAVDIGASIGEEEVQSLTAAHPAANSIGRRHTANTWAAPAVDKKQRHFCLSILYYSTVPVISSLYSSTLSSQQATPDSPLINQRASFIAQRIALVFTLRPYSGTAHMPR